MENNRHYGKDRWRDEDRHTCRRPGLAARFATLLGAPISVRRALKPGAPDEPRNVRADARNWDTDRTIKVITG